MARDITKLHPNVQTMAAQLVEQCKAQGLIIKVTDCLRDKAEQDALYAKGRTTSGSIVTNAKYPNSMHNWGIAFDICRNDGKGAYEDGDGFFKKVGAVGKAIGLEWGGDWKSIVDKPHFQMSGWGSTPSKLKAKYGTPVAYMKTWPASSGTSTNTTTASTNTTTVSTTASTDTTTTEKLSVDGLWGKSTTKRLQEIFGTPQDGIVSGQSLKAKQNNPGIAWSGSGWEFKQGGNGSKLITAIQKKVGCTQDGKIGSDTIKHMQKWLGTKQDGVISEPSAMVKALQTWANKQ